MPEVDETHLLGVVPVSWSTAVVLLVGLGAVEVGWRPVIDRTRWRPLPTLLAGVLLALTIALTIGWGADLRSPGPGCASWEEPGIAGVLLEAGHDLESFLNAALLVPLGLTLVVGARRVLPALLVVLVLPGLIEGVQLMLPGRFCSPADYLLNVAGGLIGVGAGAAAIGGKSRRGDPHPS